MWREIPKKFAGVYLDAFVVMPDHFHGIIRIGELAGMMEGQNEKEGMMEGQNEELGMMNRAIRESPVHGARHVMGVMENPRGDGDASGKMENPRGDGDASGEMPFRHGSGNPPIGAIHESPSSPMSGNESPPPTRYTNRPR